MTERIHQADRAIIQPGQLQHLPQGLFKDGFYIQFRYGGIDNFRHRVQRLVAFFQSGGCLAHWTDITADEHHKGYAVNPVNRKIGLNG